MTVEKWRKLGWNGISFKAPQQWEVSKLGLKYLMLAYRYEPVLEFKWETVFKPITLEKEFARVVAKFEKKDSILLQRQSPPDHWNKALSRFDIIGFSWEKSNQEGKGVLAHCGECGTLTVIHFFKPLKLYPDDFDRLTGRILNSFSDHAKNGYTQYCVFDIKADIPVEFKLASHTFAPGAFELQFADKYWSIILYRWSPASVLLQKSDLKTFAANILKTESALLYPVNELKHEAVQWRQQVPATMWNRLRFKLTRKPMNQWARFWHEQQKNRILALRAHSKKTLAVEPLNQICNGYESL
jgi:hypothetical protein